VDHSASIVYHPDLVAYDFGPQHPLRPERIPAGLGLLVAAGLWDREQETLTPSLAGREELELIHDPAYVRAVQDAGTGWLPREQLALYGLLPGDTPAFPGMHDAAALVAGGAASAIRAIMTGQRHHVFHPAGGLHHALRNRAAGFCVYNDPALAAAIAQREFGARVLYVDFDCHHGDGVQWLFYDNSEIMTVSFHETGRFLFPGTGDVEEMGIGPGHGFAINVPMAPFTQDRSWLEAVNALLPSVTERFRPDVIISAHGADTHEWDPLTHLSLTTESFTAQAALVHELAHAYAEGRWLAVGSGGYDWRRVVPRSWSIVWAAMSGRELPEKLDASWRARWPDDQEPIPENFRDAELLSMPAARTAEVEQANRETLRTVLALHRLALVP
jgi:acetoin utilization protein AcuC